MSFEDECFGVNLVRFVSLRTIKEKRDPTAKREENARAGSLQRSRMFLI